MPTRTDSKNSMKGKAKVSRNFKYKPKKVRTWARKGEKKRLKEIELAARPSRADAMKEKFKDPEYKEKQLAKMNPWTKPESRAKLIELQKKQGFRNYPGSLEALQAKYAKKKKKKVWNTKKGTE